ncbi:hypothetical protein FBEOM_10710 [Fusarium beomiforme]|uniref:Ankyrin repeat protein n=1 Tax=Fusarium beomiforme TaxID=44412 RepID=A0A9P5DV37_9HYPO|nr:hypothetical protein FBEOM_10710 [Fusarium beomiforme]
MTNIGASLHLKVPRIIQAQDPIWEMLRCGDINRIQQRFTARRNSPADILASGMSLFLANAKTEAGCDPSVKALNGRYMSPRAATARARVLASDVNPISERLFHLYKRIIQLDDEAHYFNSSVIHDSILKLNDITLANAIALDPQSINSLDGMGYAPLHWAVKERNIGTISTLLEYKADVDVKDQNHRTALHLAAHGGLIDITGRLIEAGCNVNSRDIWGKTALHMACNSSSMNSTTIVHEILRHGGVPNIRGITNEFTPLSQLIWQCLARDPWDCEGKIDELLKAGADINEADKGGCTPIMLASSIPWDNSLFQFLYNHGARVDALDKQQRSILHYAAAYGDLDHIEYLRKLELSDPDLESQDCYRHTPLSLLQWRSRTEDRKL